MKSISPLSFELKRVKKTHTCKKSNSTKGSGTLNGAKIGFRSSGCDTKEAATSCGCQGGQKVAGNPTFPSVLLPDKQTSKWDCVHAAPLPPHTSCDSPNHSLWAVREVPVACQPPSRTTFTRKPGLPENQPNFL